MSKSLETQLSQSLIKGRERADRLLRHVAVKIEGYVGVPSTEMIIEYCTTHSIKQCTIVNLKFNCRYQTFRGGFLFYYWLHIAGPQFCLKMLKEEEEVGTQIHRSSYEKILYYVF